MCYCRRPGQKHGPASLIGHHHSSSGVGSEANPVLFFFADFVGVVGVLERVAIFVLLREVEVPAWSIVLLDSLI